MVPHHNLHTSLLHFMRITAATAHSPPQRPQRAAVKFTRLHHQLHHRPTAPAAVPPLAAASAQHPNHAHRFRLRHCSPSLRCCCQASLLHTRYHTHLPRTPCPTLLIPMLQAACSLQGPTPPPASPCFPHPMTRCCSSSAGEFRRCPANAHGNQSFELIVAIAEPNWESVFLFCLKRQDACSLGAAAAASTR